ncbi:nad dependent epimerase [Phlyctema vagabunda]|uniref:Nad dependent epimerase n=1 Tax=Phlyctema vagabunda TaxID=108571 RepID=A0ABR4PPF3_9HELO
MSSDTKNASPSPLFLLGLSRTGSTSLEKALRMLGYNEVFSMDRLATDRAGDCAAWIHALEVKYSDRGVFEKQDWANLVGGFDVVRGLPAAAFAPEIIAAFPNSKVILTTRDVDSWYTSCMRTIRWRATDPVLRWLSKLDWQSSSLYQTLFRTTQDSLYRGDFEKHGKEIFMKHNDDVRSLVSKDLLLEYQVQQGWRPLCEFLDTDIPSCDFPRGNDPAAFRSAARKRDRAVAFRLLTQASLVGMGACLLFGAARWTIRRL